MEQILELLEKGQAGNVTAVGIGGVFLALMCMYFFISVMHRSIHYFRLRRRARSITQAAQTIPLGISADSKHPEARELPLQKTMPKEDLELAASVAVALALEEKMQTPRLNMDVVTTTADSWRIAGRLELMRPMKRDD
ncbi:MAG: OadG family protein [Deltaproteobacteria bacterium]|nr:OadG family protein [Deltaproteobacteria bacterium]MBW1870517.1 OadG family protein [Deltaproteobacteria bacterium]